MVEAKKTGTEVAVYDPGSDAGAGLENVERSEYAIPFLYVLDAKSPQCKPVKNGGLGYAPGSIYNTATNEAYDGDTGVPFVPVHRDHNFGEWIRRNPDGTGGGFVGIRSPEDPLVLDLRAKAGAFGKLYTDDNHELVETFYLYGLIIPADAPMGVLIPFKSTGIKRYRNFMTRAMGIQYQGANGPVKPPLWAHRWRLTTAMEQKGQNSWYNFRLALEKEPPIESRLKLTDPVYLQGRELYEVIKSGRVVVKHEDAQKPSEGDEVPF